MKRTIKLKFFIKNVALAGLSVLVITNSAFAGKLKFVQAHKFIFGENPFEQQVEEYEAIAMEKLEEFIQMATSAENNPAHGSDGLSPSLEEEATNKLRPTPGVWQFSRHGDSQLEQLHTPPGIEEYDFFLITLFRGKNVESLKDVKKNAIANQINAGKKSGVVPQGLKVIPENRVKGLFNKFREDKEYQSSYGALIIGIKPIPDSNKVDITYFRYNKSSTP